VNSQPKVVLSIAGFDPSSGAGVTADIKTAAAQGCFCLSCPTALTVQSTLGVKAVDPVSAQTVLRILEALAEDFDIAAVRIGMLGSTAVTAAVADFLRQAALPNIVLDPILRASSGTALLEDSGLEIVRDQLLPMATVVTPNLAEAAALTGVRVESAAEQSTAAGLLLELGAYAAVITGGHLDEARDLLAWRDESGVHEEVFTGSHLESTSTHGTGCAFATSVACGLATGNSVLDSVRAAKSFVRCAIESAPGLGHGHGPMNLLWNLKGQ
jgi:hydroxymethylpyrimidine/phosphomethylpyrimidine kinase